MQPSLLKTWKKIRMDKKIIAEILEEIGTLLELKGENPFKSRAYANAARVIASIEQDIEIMVKTDELKKLKGIGQALSEKITELVLTGRLEYYEKLKAEFPSAALPASSDGQSRLSPSLLELLRVPGLGPKKVRTLYEKLGITNIGELEYACNENRLLGLEGFGVRSQEKILQGIQYLKKSRGLFLFSAGWEEARSLETALRSQPSVQRISIAGSLRRKKEIIKDIDLVASTQDSSAVMEFFTTLPQVEAVTAKGDTKSSVILKSGIAADLRTVSDTEFPYALHHFTGSKEHNVAMRGRAQRMGLKMNEYGLFREKDDSLVPCKDEEEIFRALGLAYIPPELREDMGEIRAAESGGAGLPCLLEEGAIRGVFHTHSTYSDGRASLEEMIKAAIRLGYEYIGISDHSKSAYYARGLKEDDLKKQHDEIDLLREKYKEIAIFKGTEADILADGSVDYGDDILASFDFVIASIHSRFKMTEEEMTNRIVKAMSNPYVTMLGHSTGRLLLARDGYPVNMSRIIEAARGHDVVIEINANPQRLDLDWRFGKLAKEHGVKVSINPDAHSTEGLGDVIYGVGIARKGWLTAADVVNTMTREEMTNFLQKRKAQAAKAESSVV
jgi:DNA polymerase (family 10)